MKRNYAKNAREVCWDWNPVQESQDISLKMHKPVRKGIVMTLDQPWEGNCSGYLSVMKHGDTFRLYYRGSRNGEFSARGENGEESYKATACVGLPGLGRGTICMLESKDGKHFTRPALHNYDVEGYDSNNIVYTYVGNYLDNFSIFYDENPDCPADEKYKALKMGVFDNKTAEDPLETITKKEYFDFIEKKMDESLSDFEKKVLVEYKKGKSYNDIAKKVNVKIKSVDTAIQRIKKKAGKIKLQLEND